MVNSPFLNNSNSTFIVLNLHWVVDSKVQQDNGNIQIQSPGTEIVSTTEKP